MSKTLACLLLCVLAALPLAADSTRHVVVNIPFAFEVSGQELPAGRYELFPAGASSGSLTVLKDGRGAKSLALLNWSINGDGRPELRFTRRGQRLILTGINTRPSETDVKQSAR